MAAVTALRERARAAVFAAGGRGFVRFLPAGETALLVSDAPRRCGDVPALLDGCRAAGFDARERDGLLLLTPTEAALRALDVPARIDVDWDAPDAPTAAFAAYLMRRSDRPLTEDGLRLVVETLRLLWQDEAHVRAGLPALRARAARGRGQRLLFLRRAAGRVDGRPLRKENGLNRADACVIMMLGVGFCYRRPFAEPPARRAQTRENSPQRRVQP